MKIKSCITKLAVATVLTFAVALPGATLSIFGKKEVTQDDFIAVAVPTRGGTYLLGIYEQQSNARSCWSESGSNPVRVDLLLLTFDFTGICGRSLDSNGYSIRMADEDLGLNYSLRLQQRGNEVLLLGMPRNLNEPEVVIGRTYGISSEPMKLFLNSGWRYTKRTYEGQTLGHVYVTNNQTLAAVAGSSSPAPTPTPTPTPTPSPSIFGDIQGDIYAQEIAQAVSEGFISGFPDNTFKPLETLTREQVVSMVVEALQKIPGTNLSVPAAASVRPYPDVIPTRWSAAKIQFAQDNNIISGYPDGTFQPSQAVTRAELMAILRRAAEFAKSRKGLTIALNPTRTSTTFADISGHWASTLIDQMSSYCEVASPLNETGSSFFPNSSAQRNYAAAATLRMMNCIKNGN